MLNYIKPGAIYTKQASNNTNSRHQDVDCDLGCCVISTSKAQQTPIRIFKQKGLKHIFSGTKYIKPQPGIRCEYNHDGIGMFILNEVAINIQLPAIYMKRGQRKLMHFAHSDTCTKSSSAGSISVKHRRCI